MQHVARISNLCQVAFSLCCNGDLIVKWLGWTSVFLVIMASVVWIGGIRVIVIQPIGALPKGVTAIVAGIENVNFLDSPDAICNRHEGGVSLWCRGREAGEIAQKGKILLRLPYSEILFKMTGAPSTNR